jgi:hypothetical protein
MDELHLVGHERLRQGKATSLALRLPNGIQIKEGLNWKWSDLDTTVTSTSFPSSCFTLRPAVSPAKFPPRTSTFLFDISLPPPVGFHPRGRASFEEERRRTKAIPRLMSERATMKLAFATMIRSAERWCRVSVSDLERHQLKLLRTELGLDPPPTEDHVMRRRRRPERTAA